MTNSSRLERLSGLVRGHTSRRLFLGRSLAGVALIAPAGLLVACGEQQSTTTTTSNTTSTRQGVALTLNTPIDNKVAFNEIMNDENQHVEFLKGQLKTAARPKPTFQKLQQADVQSFANLAQTFENAGVGAYLMAAPTITNKETLAAAGSILTIEARHAGFINALLQKPLSPNGAFDKPMTQAEIVSAVSPYIASLNGGADPATTLRTDNDVLNFALLLEYLQAEFYTTNVPKLFP